MLAIIRNVGRIAGLLMNCMSKVCQITGKRPSAGNTRSHALNANKRRFQINLKKKRVTDPVTGRVRKMRVAASTLRTLDKKMV